MNIYGLFIKSFKDNLKRYNMFMLTCLIAIVGLFTVLSLRYSAMNMQMNESIISMINVSCFLIVLISVVFIRYAIISYIRIRIRDYEIYSILGMRVKAERKMMLLEFFCMGFLIMVIGECTGSILVLIFKAVCLKFISISSHAFFSIQAYIVTSLLYIFTITASILLYRVNGRKRVKNNRKSKIRRLLKGWLSLVTGAVFILISIALILNFTVGNMIIAVILNPIGIYLLLVFLSDTMIPYVKSKENIYYKKIILYSDLFDNIKIKLWIAFAVYASNFLLIYLLGSMFVTMIDDKVPYDDYFKYDLVIRSEDENFINRIKPADDLIYFEFKTCDGLSKRNYEHITIIMNSSYNSIMKKNRILENNDAYIFEQKFAEDFLPEEAGRVSIIMGNKLYDINVIDTGWEYLYTCLDSPRDIFIVVSDDLYRELPGNEGQLIFMNHAAASDYSHYAADGKNGTLFFDKAELTGKMKLENGFMFLIFFSISFILILDGSFIIYIKMFSEVPEKRQKFETLELIGMRKHEMKKVIRRNYKIIIDVPILLSLAFALLLGICDIKASPGFCVHYIVEYIIFAAIIFVIEIFYVFILREKIGKEIL